MVVLIGRETTCRCRGIDLVVQSCKCRCRKQISLQSHHQLHLAILEGLNQDHSMEKLEREEFLTTKQARGPGITRRHIYRQ